MERDFRSPPRGRRSGRSPIDTRSAPNVPGLPTNEERPETVDYLVRAARITDVDRIVTLCADDLRASRAGGDARPLDAGDLLRQLVFLPQATVLVAETRREIAGAAVLALRPSVRAGGFVGTVDLLVVDPRHRTDEVADVLIDEVIRSAANKACARVEAPVPVDADDVDRWDRHGFRADGRVISRPVAKGAAGFGGGARGT